MTVADVLASMAGYGATGKAWALKNLDTGEEFLGQYLPQNYTEGVSGIIPETSTVNQQDPFPQWVGGNSELPKFDVRMFAYSATNTVKADIDKLKNATKKDAGLNRPPLFTFKYGIDIAFHCFVQAVENIRYDEVRGDGTVRGAIMSVTLRRLENLPSEDPGNLSGLIITGGEVVSAISSLVQSVSDLINIPGGSLHKKGKTIKAKEGDTFEGIAAKEYGNALVGDILRRAQPDKANLVPGDLVTLVDNKDIFQIEVTPQSVSLRETPEAKAVRELKFEQRNRTGIKVS